MTIDESKQYIRDRITALRMKKGVSEYRMSRELGRSKGYIQGITSGKSLPSMEEFLNICEYFEVSTEAFFHSEIEYPILLEKLGHLAVSLPPEDLTFVISLTERLAGKRS